MNLFLEIIIVQYFISLKFYSPIVSRTDFNEGIAYIFLIVQIIIEYQLNNSVNVKIYIIQ